MTTIKSQSLYPVQGVERRFYYGRRYHCISTKVTLQWDTRGRLRSVPLQPEIERDDVWYGREDRSSLRVANELLPFKPTTDVLVVGSVSPPDGRPASRWAGALLIGNREKRLRFCGPREWRHGLVSGWTLSEPEPCTQVALRYENAYGGVSDSTQEQFAEGEYYPPNPHGCGFVGKGRLDTSRTYRAPQIETWDGTVTHPGHDVAVGGFGPLPGYVPDRARYIGNWDGCSDGIPLDMDLRYWNVAPADQCSDEYLKPGETISLVGMRPGDPLTLAMPPIEPALLLERSDRSREAQRMNLDTVTVDLDNQYLVLRYHGIVEFSDELDRVLVFCAPNQPLSGEVRHG